MTDHHLPRTDPRWGWEFRLEEFVHARILEDEQLAHPRPELEARRRLAILGAMRGVLAQHSIYVDSSRKNYARCYTCDPVCGVPCATLVSLATAWTNHPDAPGWLRTPRGFPDAALLAAGTFRRLNSPAIADNCREPQR